MKTGLKEFSETKLEFSHFHLLRYLHFFSYRTIKSFYRFSEISKTPTRADCIAVMLKLLLSLL